MENVIFSIKIIFKMAGALLAGYFGYNDDAASTAKNENPPVVEEKKPNTNQDDQKTLVIDSLMIYSNDAKKIKMKLKEKNG